MSFPADIDVAGLKALFAGDPVTLLDVRNDAEVATGVIAGARHIPLPDLVTREHELPRDLPLVVYCQSGARSARAAGFLANAGFGSVHNLRGGILAWLREGESLSPSTE